MLVAKKLVPNNQDRNLPTAVPQICPYLFIYSPPFPRFLSEMGEYFLVFMSFVKNKENVR